MDYNMILSIEHRKNGLQLCGDEDFVYLFNRGTEVAKWYNGPKLTVETIHDEADKWMGERDAMNELQESGVITISREVNIELLSSAQSEAEMWKRRVLAFGSN